LVGAAGGGGGGTTSLLLMPGNLLGGMDGLSGNFL
jgi:hypothetical protein